MRGEIEESSPNIQQNMRQFLDYFKKVDNNLHRMQLMEILAPDSSIIRLDKFHSIVSTSHYLKLLADVTSIRSQYDQLSKKLYGTTLQMAESEKERQKMMESLKQFKSNEDMLVKNCENLNHNLEKLKKALEDKCKENKVLAEKVNDMALTEKPKPFTQPQTLRKSIQVQTNLWTQPNSFKHPHPEPIQQHRSLMVEQTSAQRFEEAVFLQKMEKNLQSYCVSIEKLKEQLKAELQTNHQFAQQNVELKRKIWELQQKMGTINIEQEKLCIWRSKFEGIVQKVEQSIFYRPELQQGSSQQKVMEESQRRQVDELKMRIASLQERNIQLKRKFRSIEQLMAAEEQPSDESPVGNLLKLTQRLKSLVRAILVQV